MSRIDTHNSSSILTEWEKCLSTLTSMAGKLQAVNFHILMSRWKNWGCILVSMTQVSQHLCSCWWEVVGEGIVGSSVTSETQDRKTSSLLNWILDSQIGVKKKKKEKEKRKKVVRFRAFGLSVIWVCSLIPLELSCVQGEWHGSIFISLYAAIHTICLSRCWPFHQCVILFALWKTRCFYLYGITSGSESSILYIDQCVYYFNNMLFFITVSFLIQLEIWEKKFKSTVMTCILCFSTVYHTKLSLQPFPWI